MDSLLEVRELSVSYRSKNRAPVRAVVGANFRIAGGEVVGVLGESGSGKSTLAASLLAMFPLNAAPDSGSICLEGKNLLRLDDKELRQVRGKSVSLISQEPGAALHPTIRVGIQIEEVLRAHCEYNRVERRNQAIKLLDSVFPSEVERIYRSYPHQLSGGQRQRIAIAQAIACRPSLLIADEPTASLDPVTQQEILQLLKKLQAELKLAILFITHTPKLLEGFANRVFVMYAGEIIESGRTSEVLQSPLHPYTRALLGCRPALNSPHDPSQQRFRVIPGDPPDLTVSVNGCAFEPRCQESLRVCRERTPGVTALNEYAEVRCFKFNPEHGS